ncbi:MAG: fumarylacetoacetase, partial [Bacteroidetes bacterium]|nr:fumarylacetoacetase [Bacteroidota bacterium]
MSDLADHMKLHERCLVEVPEGSHFTIYNLPFGIFCTNDRAPGAGIAIGQYILDLNVLAESGLFSSFISKAPFETDNLNSLFNEGPEVVESIRRLTGAWLSGEIEGFSEISDQALVRQEKVTMLLPIKVGDYTDFYSSEEHAMHVGKLFRSKEQALM